MDSRQPWTLNAHARRWFDIALLGVLLALCVAMELAGASEGVGLPRTVGVSLMAAQVLPLWWRRRRPVEVMAAVAFFHAVQVLAISDPLPSQFAFPIAVYSVARWGPNWARYGVVGLSLFAAVVAGWRWSYTWLNVWTDAVPSVVVCAAIAMAGWAFGIAGAQRDRYLVGLVERADQVERIAQRDVALAAQDERTRIAREMHDVVAHGLSVIVVQADGARYAAGKDPQVAVGALETIAATGRESLNEMRRLLGILRTADSGTTPQPGLADIVHLIEEARDSETAVEAELPAQWPPASDGVGLAAYRFVQEALTNVRKHAGPNVTVRITARVSESAISGAPVVGVLDLKVADNGRGAAADSRVGSGLGLVGMRERVGAYAGEVEAGPLDGGGWQVSARIPMTGPTQRVRIAEPEDEGRGR